MLPLGPWGPSALQAVVERNPAMTPETLLPPPVRSPCLRGSASMEGEGATGHSTCVVARGFAAPPARTGSVGSWLSPQEPLQLHLYKQGELISCGCWAELIVATELSRACGQAGTGGLQWPEQVCGEQLPTGAHLARMRGCRGATGKLHQPCENRESKAGKEVRKGGQARDLDVSIPSLFAPHPWKPT